MAAEWYSDVIGVHRDKGDMRARPPGRPVTACWPTSLPLTDGALAGGASVSWPRQVPLGREFPVREPVWNWGFGSGLINDDASAIASIVLGALIDGFCVLLPVFLVNLTHRWRRHQGRHARV
jgi:hypothetical protein